MARQKTQMADHPARPDWLELDPETGEWRNKAGNRETATATAGNRQSGDGNRETATATARNGNGSGDGNG